MLYSSMEQSFIPFPVSLQGARQGRVFAMLSFPVAGGIFVSLARGWKELTEANERERSEERGRPRQPCIIYHLSHVWSQPGLPWSIMDCKAAFVCSV